MDQGSLFQLSPKERAERLRGFLSSPAYERLNRLLQEPTVTAERIFELIQPEEIALALTLRRSKNWGLMRERLKASGVSEPDELRNLLDDKLDAVFEIKPVQEALTSVSTPSAPKISGDFFNQITGISPHLSWTQEENGVMPMVRVALRGENGRVLLDTTMGAPMYAGFIDILLQALIQSCAQSAAIFQEGALTPAASEGLRDTFVRIREKLHIWEQLLREMQIEVPEIEKGASEEKHPPSTPIAPHSPKNITASEFARIALGASDPVEDDPNPK